MRMVRGEGTCARVSSRSLTQLCVATTPDCPKRKQATERGPFGSSWACRPRGSAQYLASAQAVYAPFPASMRASMSALKAPLSEMGCSISVIGKYLSASIHGEDRLHHLIISPYRTTKTQPTVIAGCSNQDDKASNQLALPCLYVLCRARLDNPRDARTKHVPSSSTLTVDA